MEHLITILKEHQIESDSLEVLFASAQEKSYILVCEGSTAFSYWQRLRDIVAQTGYWPVILGAHSELEYKRQHFDSSIQLNWYGSRSMSPLIEESQAIDVAKWVKEGDVERTLTLHEQERDRLRLEGVEEDEEEEDSWIQDPLEGFLKELTGQIVLGLFPTTNCWEVPALLRFGDFNECPRASVHASVMRYWSEKYGLELVGMSHCDWLAFVAQPPLERADALALALEHIEYCPEFMVDTQCHGNIEALAAWLLRTSHWSFWWD